MPNSSISQRRRQCWRLGISVDTGWTLVSPSTFYVFYVTLRATTMFLSVMYVLSSLCSCFWRSSFKVQPLSNRFSVIIYSQQMKLTKPNFMVGKWSSNWLRKRGLRETTNQIDLSFSDVMSRTRWFFHVVSSDYAINLPWGWTIRYTSAHEDNLNLDLHS